jgi:hypothetical protein
MMAASPPGHIRFVRIVESSAKNYPETEYICAGGNGGLTDLAGKTMHDGLAVPELLLAAAAGLGLAAAVGFRIFAPLLLVGLAARMGLLPLAGGFEWLGSDVAIVMLGIAAVAEITAYFIPYFDHLLDVMAGPVAMAAGTLLMASSLIEMAPWLRWVIALVAGGGTAGLIHTAMAGLRVGSSATTGGLANPALSGVETGAATLLAILAIVVPVLALVLVIMLFVRLAGKMRQFHNRRNGAAK